MWPKVCRPGIINAEGFPMCASTTRNKIVLINRLRVIEKKTHTSHGVIVFPQNNEMYYSFIFIYMQQSIAKLGLSQFCHILCRKQEVLMYLYYANQTACYLVYFRAKYMML